jgi:hypothetical protein
MDVITIYTDNYKPLYEKWLNTLPLGFNPIVFNLKVDKNDEFGFRRKTWYKAIDFKLKCIYRILKQKSPNEIILFSDVDIFFIKKDKTLFNLAVEKFNEDPLLDIWISREGIKNDVNTGFYFLRNNNKTSIFILNAIKSYHHGLPFADQTYFNNNLNTFHLYNTKICRKQYLKWDFIPNKYTIWGTQIYDKNNSIFHHATCTFNLEQKIIQQEQILNFLNQN